MRFALPLLAALLALLGPAPAQATFHLVSIREAYPGSKAEPESSYVELQMYAAGQNFVAGHALTVYNASGGLIGTFSFSTSLPGNGSNQQTILIGDSGVQSAFGVTPDLVNSSFKVPAAGGAACWASTIDCVAWGAFKGTPASPVGSPVDGAGIPDGTAIRRKIAAGTCTNLLDGADDSNDSATDFADATPAPVSYATTPTPMSCTPATPPPSAVIDDKPASATTSTSAAFNFHSSPLGAGFECQLDAAPFADCDAGSIDYPGPLSEASHTFRVRASNANGTGAPTSYSWKIDLTAPSASISSHPADPSPGKSSSFKYNSNEGGSKFECRLSPVEAAFTPCDSQPKLYANLANGNYEFEVRAIDDAGNLQSAPASFSWTVDNSLADTTAPETSIESKPPDPSISTIAAFSYKSNEPESSFECALDGIDFSSCPPTGVTYTGLGSGPHTFQVRAVDASGNTDLSPAGYSFQVVLVTSLPVSPIPTPIVELQAAPAVKPNTTISGKPGGKTRDRTPSFRFSSTNPSASFQCKLDGSPFKPCRSPFTTKKLSFGQHVLQVRAVTASVADPSPAKFGFKVVKR